MTRKKFYIYAKDGKNSNEKNDTNDNLEEYRYQENGKIINIKEKHKKLDKNKIYENEPHECSKDDKKGKNNKLEENIIYANKFKLDGNYYTDDSKENNNFCENLKYKKKVKNNRIKFNRIYIIYFYSIIFKIIFILQFIKCINRKIELAYSLINLKIIGNGTINIFSNNYNGDKPKTIIINNLTKYNNSEVNKYYNFSNFESDINNITLIWETPPSSTSNLFKNCKNIIEIDLSNFDSSQVNNMEYMLSGCSLLTSLNLFNFSTSCVTNMNNMFSSCLKLNSLDLSSFDTSKVNNMNSMFSSCSNLTSLNLSNFKTSSATTMERMFSECSELISLDLSNFDTSRVNNMHSMFNGCSKLISLDLSNFKTSSVTTMERMFEGCKSINTLDLSNFDTSKVNNMHSMFNGCSNLTSLNLSNFKTSSVTTMERIFYCCSSLISLDLSNFETSKVINMNYMFGKCSQLKLLDLSNFNASKINNMNNMFSECIPNVVSGCSNLENFNLKHANINPDIISSSSMFSNLPSKLIICTVNEDWSKIFNLSDKQYVNCINNISYFNINENEPIIKCYKNNIDTDNPCQMCGNNYYNNSGMINNTYINCYDFHYIDDNSYQVPIDTTINNVKENSLNTININDYTNSLSNLESNKYTYLFTQLLSSDYSSF